jgi:transmembrane sensor
MCYRLRKILLKDEPNDILKELIAKSLAGETTPEQESQLREWLQRDPANQRYFDSLRKVTTMVDDRFGTAEAKNLSIDVEHEWKKFLPNVQHQTDDPIVKMTESRWPGLWLKIAAGLLLLIVASLGINYLLSRNDMVQYQTAGETKTIHLPDGSTVVLNRYSKLSHHSDFSKENRNVVFSGEAFFDVKSNKNKPFIIKLKNARIEVVGTSFNVLAYDSIELAEVTVKTGVVKFSSASTAREIRIEAGNKGTYREDRDELVARVNDDINFLSWNTREIVFSETDLQTVVATLNKVYNAHIVLAADASDTCVVTVKFENQSLESVLRVLESTLNLTYSIKDNLIEISGAGC